ncbi:sulfatase-like hydrolase/transferase [Holdemania massiliensis]|uniref:sulfatase-like hydrolase/transferase n=1 Tax=Holdemania massiliensis TaxID=1468449 RepID=UPI003522CB1D
MIISITASQTRPLFLYISLLFPHPPYGCEDPWYSQIDRSLIAEPRPSALELDKPSMLKGIAEKQQLNEWGKENLRELRAVYLAMVSRFDYQFGLLRRKLIDRGLYDSSNIFVFSDHGDYTGDYQNCGKSPELL